MKLMQTSELCVALGYARSSHDSAIALMKKHKVAPVSELQMGGRKVLVWDSIQVKPVIEARAAQVRAKSGSNVVQLPLAAAPLVEEEIVASVVKGTEPLKNYLCHVGDNQLKLHDSQLKLQREIESVQSTQRELTLAINRLLSAAGLQQIKVAA